MPIRKFARRKDGSVAMEFAILLPLFVLFLWSIIQFGFVFYFQNDMINAAREAGRRLSVDDTVTYAEAETIAQNYLDSWPTAVEVAACPHSGAATQNTETWSDGTNECPSPAPDDRITVEVRADMADTAIMGDIFGFFVGREMNAYVEFRKEGID